MHIYSIEIKNRAYQLYLELGSVPEVHRKLLEEFEGVYSKFPTVATIRGWISKNNLPEVKKNLYVDAIVDARAKEMEKVIVRREEQKEFYKKVTEKVSDSLFGDKSKSFRDAYDAVRAGDIAIKGERKIETEQLNLRFVDDVFTAVSNVVQDESTLRDIGIELRKVLANYNEV